MKSSMISNCIATLVMGITYQDVHDDALENYSFPPSHFASAQLRFTAALCLTPRVVLLLNVPRPPETVSDTGKWHYNRITSAYRLR